MTLFATRGAAELLVLTKADDLQYESQNVERAGKIDYLFEHLNVSEILNLCWEVGLVSSSFGQKYF